MTYLVRKVLESVSHLDIEGAGGVSSDKKHMFGLCDFICGPEDNALAAKQVELLLLV